MHLHRIHTFFNGTCLPCYSTWLATLDNAIRIKFNQAMEVAASEPHSVLPLRALTWLLTLTLGQRLEAPPRVPKGHCETAAPARQPSWPHCFTASPWKHGGKKFFELVHLVPSDVCVHLYTQVCTEAAGTMIEQPSKTWLRRELVTWSLSKAA